MSVLRRLINRIHPGRTPVTWAGDLDGACLQEVGGDPALVIRGSREAAVVYPTQTGSNELQLALGEWEADREVSA